MGLFSRKRRADFDLASLRLPRVEHMPDVAVTSERMTVWHLTSCDEGIAPGMVPMTPFVLAVGDEPTILVKLAGMSQIEAAELARAVRAGECLATGIYRSYPTYPLLVLALFVYDSPDDPMRFEGLRDIVGADVQDFVVALGRTGGQGQIRLYGESAELLAVGRFGFRPPPFGRSSFPYRSTGQDLEGLWQMCTMAAAWFHHLPDHRRDFDTAAEAYTATEPML